MKTFTYAKRQSGAALVVGLVLLVVVTVLAISGMNTATTELAMARNDQNYENAFQAAENGLEQALAQGSFDPAIAVNITQNITAHESFTATIQYVDETMVPDRAFSLGIGSGVRAHHFSATSVAASKRDAGGGDTDRDAVDTHVQSFYVIGAESPNPFN